MTHRNDDEEGQAWLEIISGRASNDMSGSDPVTQSLRRQLKIRRDLLDSETPLADANLLEKIKFRIRREQSSSIFWRRFEVWGLAASLLLGITVVYQVVIQTYDADEQIRLRNSDDRVMILTTDPKKRSAEFSAELRAKGLEVRVDESDPKQIILTVPNTAAAVEYLNNLNIENHTSGSEIIIVLAPKRR
jgi:hypothetical protein